MIKNWILYLSALVGVCIFHVFYFGWYSWFLLVLFLCLPPFSFLVSFLPMSKARLQMELPQQCSSGDALYLSLQASGNFLPLPRCRFRLTVTSKMTGRETVLPQVVPNGGRWYISLDTTHCGTVICRVDKGRVYDYLGLFWLPLRQPEVVSCMIYPIPAQPKPLPNLSHFLVRRRKPKPGGGFSEEHEMRDYHPGDRLRDIHWKLSVKTDRTIVREAQEPIRERTLLTFDLKGTPEQIDLTLARLCWMSDWLSRHETPHQIIWIDPTDCQLAMETIESEAQLLQLLPRLLQSVLRQDIPSIAARRFAAASWRYHISAGQEADV